MEKIDEMRSDVDPFSALSEKIRSLKRKRDERNARTKALISQIRELQRQISEARNEAKANRQIRDQYNEEVQALKNKRAKLQELLREHRNRLNELRAAQKERVEKDAEDGEQKRRLPVSKIRRKIQYFETKIETEDISIEEENELIRQIIELETLLSEHNQKYGESQEARKLRADISKIRKKLNGIHADLVEKSNLSQECHEEMIRLFKQADALREHLAEIERELLQTKKEADSFHEELLKLYKERERSRAKVRRRVKHGLDKEEQEMMDEKLQQAIEKQKQGKKLDMLEARLLLERNINRESSQEE
ncbi:MAG: hypothetical protein Kow0069_13960 [Promethearchaeota archaeon]